jgi:hypothetical protein
LVLRKAACPCIPLRSCTQCSNFTTSATVLTTWRANPLVQTHSSRSRGSVRNTATVVGRTIVVYRTGTMQLASKGEYLDKGKRAGMYWICTVEAPFEPFSPFLPIVKSISYVESSRMCGSNPPPATNCERRSKPKSALPTRPPYRATRGVLGVPFSYLAKIFFTLGVRAHVARGIIDHCPPSPRFRPKLSMSPTNFKALTQPPKTC